MDYNKIFISSRQNEDPEIESFIKNKMEELEKMFPGFAKDKIDQIVLKFYERGLRDGVEFGMQEMKQRMMKEAVEGGCFSYRNGYKHISCDIDENHTDIKLGDKVKMIIIKED